MIPPPNAQVLSLISALSNTSNHSLHVQAIRARDEALSASPESYNHLCLQLAYVMVGSSSASMTMGSDNNMLSRLDPDELEAWRQTDPQSVLRLQQDPGLWVPFGQMAGLILKNALLRPPTSPPSSSAAITAMSHSPSHHFSLHEPVSKHVQDCLLFALGCPHSEIRAVASSIISTLAVSSSKIQPALHLCHWRQLIPTLIHNLQQQPQQSESFHGGDNHLNNAFSSPLVEGSLLTVRKIMEDGPKELDQEELDMLIPVLLHFLHSKIEFHQLAALQSLVACLSHNMMPSALVLHFDYYLDGLSQLAAATTTDVAVTGMDTSSNNQSHSSSSATTTSPAVRQWVCRNIVTLLAKRTEFLRPHFESVCRFMLSATATAVNAAATSGSNESTAIPTSNALSSSTSSTTSAAMIALEACEFWLTFANLEESACTAEMSDVMTRLILPQLIPILLQCMIYTPEQQEELTWRNTQELQDSLLQQQQQAMRPVFHRSKALRATGAKSSTSGSGGSGASSISHGNHFSSDEGGYDQDDEGGDNDEDGDDDDDNDEDNNEWTLRKCAAASLDSLAGVYGAEPILPHLLPALEQGLRSTDPWVQEASILALGAVAEGCSVELSASMTQLHAHLLHILAMPENSQSTLPQLKCISAWTIGRYSHWAVEQVQTGIQGHLLAHMTEVFMTRLGDCNRRVQVACCSAFGVLVEVAGDLMAPYLAPVYQTLAAAMTRYQGRSLLMVFDVLGIMADCCGPAIAEGDLPSVYVPPLLRMWDGLAKNDPTDRTLLPLMESLASIAVTSGMNFQPYALECFENAMAIIESVSLLLVVEATESSMSGYSITMTTTSLQNEEDVDPIVCATDLLDGLVEGLGSNFQALVNSSQRYGPPLFLTVLHSLCSYQVAGVRMSAFALLGDLTRHAPALLEPALPQLLHEAVQAMDPIHPRVSTNAVWAIGEICLKCRPPQPGHPDHHHHTLLEPFVPSLMQNLIALLTGNGIDSRCVDIPGLAENAAACVGRLALVKPEFVAPDLSLFLLGWCDGLAKISDPGERRDGFSGFLAAVYANPRAIQEAAANPCDAIISILFAIVTWHFPSELFADHLDTNELLHGSDYTFRAFPQQESDLGVALMRLVQDMKTSAGEETWKLVEKGLPVNVRRLLRQSYNL